MSSALDAKRNEFILSEALAVLKEGDIETCDSCEKYVLRQHMHSYDDGSMGKQYSLCPECDLPEKWSSKPSRSRNMRYYVYIDPQTNERWMKWGHPTKGNPFFIEGDIGRAEDKRNKRRKM